MQKIQGLNLQYLTKIQGGFLHKIFFISFLKGFTIHIHKFYLDFSITKLFL